MRFILAVLLAFASSPGFLLAQTPEDEPSPPAVEEKKPAEGAYGADRDHHITFEPSSSHEEETENEAAEKHYTDVERDRQPNHPLLLGDSPAQAAMAWAAIAATVLTAIGVVFLFFTLLYTRRASIEARNANIAANSTLDVTREIGIAQIRSYISIVGGGYILNKSGYSGWVDVVNKGLSPAISASVEFSIHLELAWFGGAWGGIRPSPFDLAPHVARKPKIQPGEVSRFYFAWTREQFGDRFASLDDERFTVVITCRIRSDTIYPGIADAGEWQLTNYPGFVRSTERSLVSKGDLHPRQLQRQ